ncbi:MAG: ArnT family glycosyltransferase [Vicinamibacteria bacterium]
MEASRGKDVTVAALLFAGAFFLGGVPVRDAVVFFQLGPNDHHYLQGFASHYEVEEGTRATRWTTYQARVDLPLLLEGGPAEISYRFSRVFGETAEVEVTFDGSTIDRFHARGGTIETRRVRLPSFSSRPLSMGFHVDSHERRNMGLKLDWIRIAAGPGGAIRPRGSHRWLLPAFGAFSFLLFRRAGLGLWSALFVALAFLLATFAALRADVFGFTHALALIALPMMLLATSATLIVRRLGGGAWVVPIFVGGYLLRGLALFHPATFYPDVQNARDYVEVFRETSGSLAERGVETQTRTNVGFPREVAGKNYAFPYSPLYFLPFQLVSTPGEIEDAVRHAGLAAATLEVLPIFWIASRVFSPPAGVMASLLWMLLPPVLSRLLLALHATLVGSFLDTLVIASVLLLLFEPRSRWRLGGVAAATLASLLVYTSSLFSVSAFFLFVSLLERKFAPKLLPILAASGTIAVVWLYGPFLIAFFTEILPALSRGQVALSSAGEAQPVRLALSRIPMFYGVLYPVLAVAGIVLAKRRADPRAFHVLAAWGLAFVLMVSLRAFGGGLFKDIKEIEFAAPLVAILTGGSLAALADFRPRGRILAFALTAALLAFGVYRYRDYLERYASPITARPDERSAVRGSPPSHPHRNI